MMACLRESDLQGYLEESGPTPLRQTVELLTLYAGSEPRLTLADVSAALADGEQPHPFAALRASCRVRTTTLHERLAAMIAAGSVVKSADGYSLASR